MALPNCGGNDSLKSVDFACGNIKRSFLGVISFIMDVSLGGFSKALGRIGAFPLIAWGSVSSTTSAENNIKRLLGECLLMSSYQAKLLECLLNREAEACRAIQHAFLKPSQVNLISKDAIYAFTSWFTLQTSDYDVIIDFRVN